MEFYCLLLMENMFTVMENYQMSRRYAIDSENTFKFNRFEMQFVLGTQSEK